MGESLGDCLGMSVNREGSSWLRLTISINSAFPDASAPVPAGRRNSTGSDDTKRLIRGCVNGVNCATPVSPTVPWTFMRL